MDETRARRNRDLSLRFLLVGVALLILFGFGYGFSSYLSFGGAGDLLYVFGASWVAFAILGGVLLLCAGSAAAWMFWGWRLRRIHDPWAYDPALDGPDPRRPREFR